MKRPATTTGQARSAALSPAQGSEPSPGRDERLAVRIGTPWRWHIDGARPSGGEPTSAGYAGDDERGEQEPKGVGVKGVTREAVSGEVALELLDEVLRLPPLVIPGEHVGRAAASVRNDETDIRPLRGMFDHRKHAPRMRPAAGLV